MNNLLSLFHIPAGYFVFLPEILLIALGLLALVFSVTRLRTSPVALYTLLWAQVAVFVYSIFHAFGVPAAAPRALLGGMLQSGFGLQIASLALQAMGLVVAWMSKRQAQKEHRLPLEYYGILTAATVSLMLFIKSAHLVMFFLMLEASSLFVVLLLAIGNPMQPKNALKYLIQSGLSGVVMLWGIVFLYIHGGSLQYDVLAQALSGADSIWAKSGVALVLAGVLFKLGLFPFSFYLPEIYENASRPVIAFLSTASKFAASVGLLFLLAQPFRGQWASVLPLLTDIVILSLVWGALSALHQTNVKRLLALSGVVHAAFITAGILFSHMVALALPAVFFYFLVYVPAVFLLLYCLTEVNPADPTFEGLKNSHQRTPVYAILMALAVGSMAGLPPLGGFIAKFMMLYNVLSVGHWTLLGAMIFASILGLYYYLALAFGIIGRQGHQPAVPAPSAGRAPVSTLIIITLMTCMILVLGIFQGNFGALFK